MSGWKCDPCASGKALVLCDEWTRKNLAFCGYILGSYSGSMGIMERNMKATIIGYLGMGIKYYFG